MGNTFASLHILNSDFDEVDCALSNYQFEGKKEIGERGRSTKRETQINRAEKEQISSSGDVNGFFEEIFCRRAYVSGGGAGAGMDCGAL